MPRMNKLSNYATTISADAEGTKRITYRSTIIVEFNDERIILRTGGYDTVTTRRKMNQAATQFALGFQVYHEKGVTYVANRIGRIELGDGVTIDRKHYANVA